MADPDPIVSVSAHPGQPWDATGDAPVAGWDKPADSFDDGPGPWKQV